MHLELEFLITLQAQRFKLSPPSPLPAHFFAQELRMFLVWNSQSFLLQLPFVVRDSETGVIQLRKSKEAIQKWRHEVRERGLPKISDEKWRSGEGVRHHHQKKLCRSFYFSLVFCQRSISWDLGSIPVMVSFQVLAWVRALRQNNFTKIWYPNLVVSFQIHIN